MKTLWFLLFLLAGSVAQSVDYNYSDSCAVKGSTVTLPCTFTPYKYRSDIGGSGGDLLNPYAKTPVEIIRVVWCQNHLICQGSTPSVYDSDSITNNSRYRYLGDKKQNCTLQITNLQEEDNGTFRFRMEAHERKDRYTGQTGVNVTVVDGPRMDVTISSGEFKGGETVTLLCSSLCTFHQLEVTWLKDGRILPESDPALQVGPLTAKDSGNYNCALRTNMNSLSAPFSLQLEARAEQEGEHGGTVQVVRVVLFTLHTVLFITVSLVVIKRTLLTRKLQQEGEGSH